MCMGVGVEWMNEGTEGVGSTVLSFFRFGGGLWGYLQHATDLGQLSNRFTVHACTVFF